MKQLFFLFVFFGSLICAQQGISQTDQQRNEIVLQRLKDFINSKATDSVYALLDANFQKQFSRETIEQVLVGNVYSLGGITGTKESVYREGVSTYKVNYTAGVQEVIIGTDSAYKVFSLAFREWKDKDNIAQKTHKASTTNKLASKLDRQVDSAARRYIDQFNTAGLSIGILKDGKIVTYGYGETEKGNGKIPGSNTLFEIGSITKTFTATLLAWYVQHGKVALSDPIIKYLPDSVAANKELSGITLQMLSNHTSGLARVPFNLALGTAMADPYRDYDKAKLFYFLKNCKLQSAPGEKYSYSNAAVGLLAVILEGVSGMPYEAMVKEIITKPLRPIRHNIYHPDK